MEKEAEGLCKITSEFLEEYFDEQGCQDCDHFSDCIKELGIENLFDKGRLV